ncbi:MAG: phage BR0599 family protein, partial [Novosphingobium sp.]|nr:phage BR0599 family protein [Novosphingobium sp.]
ERPLAVGAGAGLRVILREGCDHTIGTCADRFGNGVNFQGEPFLPGNDLLTRYPAAQ